jgi:hypothetical protein
MGDGAIAIKIYVYPKAQKATPYPLFYFQVEEVYHEPSAV